MVKKKGQIELQFNWIFVLIAGALILIFFVSTALKFKSSSESELSAKVLINLEEMFVGAELSTSTFQMPHIPKTKIDFSCGEYRVEGSTFSTGIIFFSPLKFNSENIVLWSKPFDIPFKATDFLYVTSPEIRYVFVGSANAKKIFDELPENFSETTVDGDITTRAIKKELVSAGTTITDENDQHVRFVFIDIPVDKSMADRITSQRSFLKVDTAGKKLVFNENGEEKARRYLTDVEVYGAIFSDDYDFFDCTLKSAFKRAGFVMDVYSKRAQELSNLLGMRCVYPEMDTFLSVLSVCSSGTCDYGALESEISTIKSRNKALIQKEKCAPIY